MTAPDSKLTPALLDLMEHERVIEQGLHTFVDVGLALLAIRDGRKYRAAGYSSFERYLAERWEISRPRAYQLIDAAETYRAVSTAVDSDSYPDYPLPASEREIRQLARLPLNERAGAWVEAVDLANDEVDGMVVAEVVERRRQPIRPGVDHPATFSRELIDVFAGLLEQRGVQRILDPFAGTGLVHALADRLGVDSVGVEIEPEWSGLHERTICADARTITRQLVGRFDCVVTSPTYGNRMADHHEARDESDRPTYRHRLGRPLTDGNAGGLQWSGDYRALHVAVWRKVVGLLSPGGLFVLNVKDHIRAGERQPVSAWHVRTLLELGLRFDDDASIVARGLSWAAGANGEIRSSVEHVYLLSRA